MGESTRVVTFDSNDQYVRNRSNVSAGICVDLWLRTVYDLGLKYTEEVVTDWCELFEYLRDNKTDVIMQRVDEGQMEFWNVSK